MPYPNEHACRITEPEEIKPDSYSRLSRKSKEYNKTYDVLVGRLKTTNATVDQAYRYDKQRWMAGEARGHCKKHDGKFEPAKGSKK